ncbi:MAG: M23 family metallopeptidase [Clostridia bacterium]|nr:M23 family metallopeptidase [Clostridia bacterium]
MSKFYRNRTGFLSSLTKGGGLYAALGATALIAVSLIALLFSPGEPALEVVVPSDTVGNTDSVVTDSLTELSSVSLTTSDSTDDSSQGATEDASGTIPEEDVGMILPVSGTVGTDFSLTVPVFSETMNDWRVHQGIDFLTEGQIDVVAVADGVVEQVYIDELMGLTVEIVHADGTISVYQSLSGEAAVIGGQEVRQGDVIGKSGNSADCECLVGDHLHFALVREGVYLDPNDRFTS